MRSRRGEIAILPVEPSGALGTTKPQKKKNNLKNNLYSTGVAQEKKVAINIPGIELMKKLLKKLFVCSGEHFEIDRNAASQPLLEYTQPEQSRIIVLLLRYAVTRHSPMLCRVHPMPHLPLSLHTPQRSFLADEQLDGFWKENEVTSMDYMEKRDKHCSARLYISPKDHQENMSVKRIPL